MKLFFCLLLFVLPIGISSAQTCTVRGKIINNESVGVSFASVNIKNTRFSTITDVNGKFMLNNVPYGQYELGVTSVEIQPKSEKLSINKPNVELAIKVIPQIIGLNEVQIIHKTEKKELETQGFAVNVIETREVAQRNFQTNEMLDRTVGIRVRQNGGLGSAVNYNLNGMSGNSVRIFIDGIPISTYGESFSLNSIPPALIERIEVYKGVIPAHLADDALGGGYQRNLEKRFLK